MNANELLAYNQGYNAGLKAGIDLNTEPMLRNQQAEIAELKVMLGHYEDVYEGVVTHPVKELTNEKILEVIKELEHSICFSEGLGFFELKEFAEAILRKASEK